MSKIFNTHSTGDFTETCAQCVSGPNAPVQAGDAPQYPAPKALPAYYSKIILHQILFDVEMKGFMKSVWVVMYLMIFVQM